MKEKESRGSSVTIGSGNYTLPFSITTCDLQFKYLSDPLPQQRPLKQECVLMVNPQIVSGSPLSFKIDTELQNGPCLLLNQPIPLKIDITKHGDVCCGIILNEFQTMLVEKTQVKAQGITESSTSTWIVQSSANMDYPVALAKSRAGKVVTLRDSIYSQHPLPPGLTSSFETQTIIQEFDFPVYVMGSASMIPPLIQL
ncbi:hypothetical protein N7541_002939 [Penicillium brevicompactum]|uniref:Uncharacterized protein n=1 Tax=Penicillium brevicompactum TaxID=5074 RepID=A0A9W9V0L5_PENBR|nr:hypothetical protein N7541_002939 [Penicillium brevicompactum]